MNAALVFVGGGAGAVLRWSLTMWSPGPWGIVLINLLGSVLLAVLSHPRWGASPTSRLLLGTGMLGGFTTYSTFNLDLLTAIDEGAPGRAFALAVATLAGCLAASALTWWCLGPPRP